MPWRGGYDTSLDPGSYSPDYAEVTDGLGAFYPVAVETAPSGRSSSGQVQGSDFVWSEDFEGAAGGTVWSATNTSFTNMGASPSAVFTATTPIYGSLSVRVNPGVGLSDSGEVKSVVVTNTAFLRMVIDLDSGWPVGGSCDLISVRGAGAGTLRARLSINPSGQIVLQNLNTIVYTSTALPASGRVRIEWKIDAVAGQTARISYGADITSATATIDSGAQTYTQGSMDSFKFGMPTNAATSPFQFVMDECMVRTDDWCGPPASQYVPPTVLGSVDATAAASAAVVPTDAVIGTLNATASATASVAGFDTTTASEGATAAASAAVTGVDTIPLSVAATAAASASVAASHTVFGSVAATASASASLTGADTTTAAINATAVASAAISGADTIPATAGATAGATAAVAGFETHAASETATAAATAAVTGAIGTPPLDGTLTATGAATAAFGATHILNAAVTATAAASAATTASHTVLAGLAATADASAQLTAVINALAAFNATAAATVAELVTVGPTGPPIAAGPDETLVVRRENRTLLVLRETRTATIARENRTVRVPTDGRTLAVPADNRGLVIRS